MDSYHGKICTEVFQVRRGAQWHLVGRCEVYEAGWPEVQPVGPPGFHSGSSKAWRGVSAEDVRPLAGDAEDAMEAQTVQNSMSMSLPMFMSPTTSEMGDMSPKPEVPRSKWLYLDIDMDGVGPSGDVGGPEI